MSHGYCNLTPTLPSHMIDIVKMEREEPPWGNFPADLKKLLLSSQVVKLSKLLQYWKPHRELTTHGYSPVHSYQLVTYYLARGDLRTARNLIFDCNFKLYMSRVTYNGEGCNVGHAIDYFIGRVKFYGKQNFSKFRQAKREEELYRITAENEFPVLHDAYKLTSSDVGIGKLQKHVDSLMGDYVIEVEFIDGLHLDGPSRDERVLMIRKNKPLKDAFQDYAKERNISLRSLRFTYNNKMLFLSSIAKSTTRDLGLSNGDTIVVTNLTETASEDEENNQTKASHCKNTNKGKKRRNVTKQKKKKPKKPPVLPPCIEKTEEELKVEVRL